MFNSEFYPTPREVLDKMGIDCYGLTVLEPSAGKGDIIDYCMEAGAQTILACEINSDLRRIISHKADVIASNFFSVTSSQVSHVNLIVMNPPFSAADKHILHAWDIAPEGCEIIALCNWQTIENTRGWNRSQLSKLVEDYGEKKNIGDCFSNAERKTDVEVGLIHLFKPVVSEGFDWDGFFFTTEVEYSEYGIMSYNDVRAIVNTYVAAVKCFSEAIEIGKKLNSLTGSNSFKINVGDKDNIVTKEEFARVFQIQCWKKVFNKMNIEKHVTQGVMQEINKFAAGRQNYPFTMRNVYRMLEIIYGTREETMKKAIAEAVDNFTRHTHENRFGVEGWKTNEGHLLAPKFIVNRIAENEYGDGLRIKNYQCRNTDHVVDLMKALCFITGTDFSVIPSAHDMRNLKPNKWYDWGFFQFRVFKKGTGHFKFKDMKVWEQLNRLYAKIKGLTLPERMAA